MKISDIIPADTIAAEIAHLADLPMDHLQRRLRASERDGRGLALAAAMDQHPGTIAALAEERARWARFRAEIMRRGG